ncbi:MAG TPA: ABATE domain-containing protein [Methylomirabilota bacterium]|nr:ABATE domain-containing protein [Methylomirabilota bacterium]
MVSDRRGRRPSGRRFVLIGGRLCVDFANTVYAPDDPAGALGDFDDLVAFLQAAGAVDGGGARELRALARRRPRQGAAAFAGALALRDTLRGWLVALEAGAPVQRAWVRVINGILRSDVAYPQLLARRDRWVLVHRRSRPSPLAALVPLARSAAELMQEGPAAPVRKCASEKCLLYFYDGSRRRTRRWCSMAVCGNRMKVAAHAGRARGDLDAARRR